MIPRRPGYVPQKHRSRVVSLPAPVGGWNARDGLAGMKPNEAVILTNLFPSTTAVEMRAGYSQHSTGYGAVVETLIAYSGGATNKLKAIAGGSVYDATSSGAIGAAELSSLTNSRWQYVNLTTSGGSFIEMCNGADGVYTYDGTTWTDRSASITGVTAANLTNINVHKNRVWFTEAASLKAWYLPTQSITGAAAALDLSAFCPHGGFLQAIATWTVDAGYGVDDLWVAITSEGDALVYRGTDPSSASTWALVGVYELGSPIGRRCMFKYKGDLLVITQDGVVPLSGALQSSRTNPRVAVTDKITLKVSEAIRSYGSNFGWELASQPNRNALLLNVPVTAGNLQEQYVMNMITGAWCNFTGWNANTFAIFNDELYFGGTNYVGKTWDTQADAGTAVFIDGLQAFNKFGIEAQTKRFSMMRPMVLIDSTQTIRAGMNIDFDQTAPASSIGTVAFTGALWDTGVWDTAQWSDDLSVSKLWQGATGVGYWGAPHLQANISGARVQWVSTDVVLEPGAIL